MSYCYKHTINTDLTVDTLEIDGFPTLYEFTDMYVSRLIYDAAFLRANGCRLAAPVTAYSRDNKGSLYQLLPPVDPDYSRGRTLGKVEGSYVVGNGNLLTCESSERMVTTLNRVFDVLENGPLFQELDDNVESVGFWVDDDNTLYIDKVSCIYDVQEALNLAKENKELAIYHPTLGVIYL